MLLRLLLSFTILFLCSCSEDECEGREYFEIFPSVKESIPYIDGSTISYKDNNGESFSVNVERVLEITRPDIPFVCDELLTVFLREGNNQIPFVEIIQRGTTQDEDAVIQLTVFFDENGNGNIAFIKINDDGTLTSMFGGVPIFHNSISLDDTVYNDVLEINYETSLDDDSIVQLFYNKRFGLLQYSTREGLVVDLDN